MTDERHWGHRYLSDGRLERSDGMRVKHRDELEYRGDRSVVYRGRVLAARK